MPSLYYMRISLLLVVISYFMVACDRDDGIPPDNDSALYFPSNGSDTWQEIDIETLEWDAVKLSELCTYLEETETRAFLILKNGQIVVEKYFNRDLFDTPFGQQSWWYWASAGKSLTGFLFGQAIEDGLIALDTPSNTYLGSGWTLLPAERENKITVRHHLTMTTGLDERGFNDCLEPECLTYRVEPGTRWAYHNAPYTLTHNIIDGAVNTSFVIYFNERLRDVIGMDGEWQYVGNSHLYFSTARSMARFGLLMLNKGSWGEDVILNSAYYDEMINPSQDFNRSYGYLWWLNGESSHMLPGLQFQFNGSLIKKAPDDMIIAAGKNGQLLNIVPSQNLIIVRMGDNPDNSFVPINYANEIWDYLDDIIF